MLKSIKDVLEQTTQKYKDKIIFSEMNFAITYQDFFNACNNGASFLLQKNLFKKNIMIFIDKSIHCLEAMFSCAFAGSIYTVIDVHSPVNRIQTIIDTLKPSAIIADDKSVESCQNFGIPVYSIDELISYPACVDNLEVINNKIIDTDPLYILFTSGSTGIPKGSVITHKSVISYAEVICETFGIDENTIFGSQTPFYFSMSILDVFATIFSGATLHIIPKMYFSFPVKLIEHLNQYKINTIYWVPTAMSIVANFKTFEVLLPKHLKTILFAGEVMPVKQLNVWRKYLPHALYANLFGPTEITDTGTYYIVDKDFLDHESLPIGVPFKNVDALVIKDNRLVDENEVGELCFRGSFLGLGYYNNLDKTSEVFIQNPLEQNYPEIIYRTGDLVKYADDGNLLYLGRKDFQIKHMGYRIELGEIESNIIAIDGILSCACIYNTVENKIVLFYQSNTVNEEALLKMAQEKLVPYMVPNKIIKLDRMPINANGKIDRVKLKEMEM